MHEPLLIGNNFAQLVAASELARRGHRATLMTDGKPLGGHFAGMVLEGRSFDMGMVLLERLVSTQPGAELATYDASRRNDWTRFADRAGAWLDEHASLRRTPTAQCFVEGRFVPDYLLANRLEAFNGVSVPPSPALPQDDPRHASHKADGAAYDSMSYAEAARLNHGEALHARFIEPIVRKLLNVGSDAFEARFHRAAWVPLYYPQTLAAALCGAPTGLPEYPFWTTASGSVSQWVNTLVEGLRGSSVTVVEQPVTSVEHAAGRWCAQTHDARRWTGSQLALGLPVDRARALFGLPAKPAPAAASVSLGLCLVRADAVRRALTCLMVVDERYAAYRVSDQDALAGIDTVWHRVVIEANPQYVAQSGHQRTEEPVESVLRRELACLMDVADEGAVRVLKTLTARNALALPTSECIADAGAGHAELQLAAPGAALTGALLHHGCASLNDQIVQGLKIAEEFA